MFVGAGLAAFVAAGVVAAGPAAGDKGGNSGAPPGNNATIKINNVPVDNVDNQPHITCPFRVSLYNFDSGADVSNSALVTFVAQPPSGKDISLPPSLGDSSFTFPGPDYFMDYSFDPVDTLGPLFLQPQQGYHVKITVKVTSTGVTHGQGQLARSAKANGKGNGNANGNANGKSSTKVTTKHKVFWLTCSATPVTPTPTPTVTPTPTPTISVLGEKHTRKPPTTQVKGVKVQRLPFTGISNKGLTVSGLAVIGFLFTGSGLVLLGRRPKTQLLR